MNQEVGIIIPIYQEETKTAENISIRHLLRYLSSYEILQVSPQSLEVKKCNWRVIRFPDQFFQSTNTYSKLLLSKDLSLNT